MRTTTLLFALLGAALLCLAASQTQVGQLLVLASAGGQQQQPSTEQEVSVSGVANVLAKLMGISTEYFNGPAVDVVAAPARGHLIVVVEGAPKTNALESEAVARYSIWSEKQPASWLLTRMFTGAADVSKTMSQREPASLHDAVAESQNGKSLVISVASDALLLDIASPHDELLQNHPTWRTFSILLDEKLQESKADRDDLFATLTGSIDRISPVALAKNAQENIFNLEADADRMFVREMSAITALLTLWNTDSVRALIADSDTDLYTFVFSSLQHLGATYGESSVQYQTAWAQMSAILPQVAKALSAVYQQQATASVVLLPFHHDAPVLSKQGLRTQRAVARSGTQLYTCYDTLASCELNTGNCTNRAPCHLFKTDGTQNCFRCKCGGQYAGEKCEYSDVSAMFWIMFFLVVAVIVALLMVVMALAYTDPGTNTLLFKTGQVSRQKVE